MHARQSTLRCLPRSRAAFHHQSRFGSFRAAKHFVRIIAAQRIEVCNRLIRDALLFVGMKDTVLGRELPMPLNDVYIAIATVALFIPTVIVVHNSVAFIVRKLQGVKKQQ